MYTKPWKMSSFKQTGSLVSELCPWSVMIEEGICLSKNADLIRAYSFVAPDLGSSSAEKIASVASLFNRSLMNLGEGWGVQFEVQRSLSNLYPGAKFENIAGYLVERQRELNFMYEKAHFVNNYFIVFTYQLPSDVESKATSFFFKNSKISNGIDIGLIKSEIKNFTLQCDKTVAVLQNIIPFQVLNSDDLLSLFHTSLSLDFKKIVMPEGSQLFLDNLICDKPIETSIPLKVGEYYVPVIGINSFPSMTVPAMLDALNASSIPYRWSTRYITFSRDTAKKVIEKYQKKFYGSRKSIGQFVMETTMSVESGRTNTGAMAQEGEANEALGELALGNVGFGEYCSNLCVWDTDLDNAMDKAKYLAGIVGSCGFTVKEETHNSLQAFLSMLPGNLYANIRNTILSTANVSHVIPISSVWSGNRKNAFLDEITGINAPHVICNTNYGIPFFLNLNVRDVGHTWISGPTGAGKSTFLALLEVQWLKYKNSKVIILDKDRSARGLTINVGGIYLEPGKDDVAFQPLAELESMEDKRWAAEFIECLLTEQKIEVTAGMRNSINDAITLLASMPKKSRTISSFKQYCNSYANPVTGVNDIVEGVSPYTISGQYGNLFDADSTNIAVSKWTMFEMGTLMNMASGAVAPSLMFIFREIEKHFTGEPVLLVLDEAWLFLKNPVFANKIVDWLKTLRKKHVFCVFATQEIDDAANSPIASTLVSQCASKIYLADPSAHTSLVKEAYVKFGLEDSEIDLLAKSQLKQDYFYKSSLGARQFQLNLDKSQLGIITTNHEACDYVEEKYGKNTGIPRVMEMLEYQKIPVTHLTSTDKETA